MPTPAEALAQTWLRAAEEKRGVDAVEQEAYTILAARVDSLLTELGHGYRSDVSRRIGVAPQDLTSALSGHRKSRETLCDAYRVAGALLHKRKLKKK
jgi:hypothetical protein